MTLAEENELKKEEVEKLATLLTAAYKDEKVIDPNVFQLLSKTRRLVKRYEAYKKMSIPR
jgi:hypothetical protein